MSSVEHCFPFLKLFVVLAAKETTARTEHTKPREIEREREHIIIYEVHGTKATPKKAYKDPIGT